MTHSSTPPPRGSIICIPAGRDAPLKAKVYLYMVSHKHTIANTEANEEIDLNNAAAIGAILAITTRANIAMHATRLCDSATATFLKKRDARTHTQTHNYCLK